VVAAACAVTSTGCGGSDDEQPVALHRGQIVRDATGDAPAHADIRFVSVSDRRAGALSFKVGLVGPPTPDTGVVVLLDTDRSKATGAGDIGADYAVAASELDESDPFVELLHWDGETFVEADFDYGVVSSVDGGVLTIDVDRVERFAPGFRLGVTTGGKDGRLDQAPDSAELWSYSMQKQVKPTLSVVGGVEPTPRLPRAGHRFAASIHLLGSAGVDAGNDIDDFTCSSTIGEGVNETISDPDAPSTATARCTWRIPRGTGGKTFRGSLNIGFRGKTLSRSISTRISP
jgi:hypothetical protein